MPLTTITLSRALLQDPIPLSARLKPPVPAIDETPMTFSIDAIECAHFVLCHKCVSSVQIQELHDISHHLTPVDIMSGDGIFAKTSPSVHQIISRCKGCRPRGVNIDFRLCYKCLSCPNFIFCNDCIENVRY